MKSTELSALADILTDLRIEIKAIYKCLLLVEVPDLTQTGMRKEAEQERGKIHADVLEQLAALRSSDLDRG